MEGEVPEIAAVEVRDDLFCLTTAHTSYWFVRTEHGHLEHVHHGPRLAPQDPTALRWKRTARMGSAIAYDAGDVRYGLDTIPLEWSGPGQGDYRRPPLVVRTETAGYDLDLVYRSHRVVDGTLPVTTLPAAYDESGAAASLEVTLADERAGIEVRLVYTVLPECDVIARRAVVRNTGASPATVEALMSAQVDLTRDADRVLTLSGTWNKETHRHLHEIGPGIVEVGSTTGSSSNRHNPAIVVLGRGAGEDVGRVHGFALVYSGNHVASVERGVDGLVRVLTGINPQAFAWPLAPGEELESPEAVLCFSDAGLNGLSDRMHRFVLDHVVPARYRDRPRPVVYNTWEALGFALTEERLLDQARQAADLGIETFVIDDGWFTRRNDDTAGLGDYAVDPVKLPRGLGPLVADVRAFGLEVGIWVEPECVSEDSDLFRAHPDWALRVPGKPARLGRDQHVLDLTNPDVCDHLVYAVGALLDSADIGYVKWDVNRHLTDLWSAHVAPGQVAHAYTVNLHRVLDRIFGPRPDVLLVTCGSGGDRFDLAMLTHSLAIWASDDTDPIERLEIQQGLSYFYPPAVIGAHVSSAPHSQTLRDTPLSTRFNVAAFGALGYEYDLDLLTDLEREEVRDQIAFYREHRSVFQRGRFRRLDTGDPDRFVWQVGDPALTVVGSFRRRTPAGPEPELLPVAGLDAEAAYVVTAKPQRLFIERFGHLVTHLAGAAADEADAVMEALRGVTILDAAESYAGTGALLAEGIRLDHRFLGTEYHDRLRILGDDGSTLYVVRREDGDG